MPLELSVPYADKDEAKRLGAFWMPERKVWVIPDHIPEIDVFNTWIPFQEGCIVRKPYLICLSKTNCWKCGKETPMVALGAENYFAFEDRSWVKIPERSLFSWVLILNEDIARYIRQYYPFFKQTYSRTLQMVYYGNTCISCGNLQGDFFHHEEPGGAFFPDPFDNSPTSIILKNIDLGFDYHINASFGGTAYDDIFYPENKARLAKQGLRVHILKS
jgi:Domain of unknown function (DUF5710)